MSRVTLKPVISKLREIIIKNIAGKMEKFGFDISGKIIVNKPLSEYDTVIKNNLVSLFDVNHITGNKKEYIDYIQDSARTFLHILISFKTMEKRGLISKILKRLLDGAVYDQILPDFNSISPIAFTDLTEKHRDSIVAMEQKDNAEEDIDYYNFIFMLSELSKEMAKEVPLLFKDYEHNLVQPDFAGVKEILFTINKVDDEEYFEDDFLGWIYQYWVDIKDDEIKLAKENKEFTYKDTVYYEILNNLDAEQTQFGEFYTPRWVVKYIVDNTLKPYFEEHKKIESIKLLDPACGAGNFLVYSFDVFYELYKVEHPDWTDNVIINSILEKNIFGVDIQREPLQVTALNLWLKAKKKASDVNIKNFNLFNMNILKANSLYRWENDKEEILQTSIFQTDMELTEKQYTAEDIGKYISGQKIMAKRDARVFFKNKFNVIVMNPPFVDARKMDSETSNFLKREYPQNARNLFSAFIERAIELTLKRGMIGFISSDTFMTISSFTDIRKEILNATIVQAVLLGNDVFDGPTVSASIIVMKNSQPKNNKIVFRNVDIKSTYEIGKSSFKIIMQKKLSEIKNYPFIFHVSDNFRQLFKIKSIGEYDKIFEVRKGIVTAKNNKFLRYKWEVPSEQVGTNFLIYNKDIENYSYSVNQVLDWRVDTQKEILKSPSARCAYIRDCYDSCTGKYNFKKGILFSLTGDLKFCKLESNLFDVSFPAILIKNHIYNHYMLALLSSKIAKYVLHIINSTIHTTPGDVRRLPFKIPNKVLLDVLNKIISRIVEIKEYLLGFNYVTRFYREVELVYGFKSGAKTVINAYEIFIKKYNELENEIYNLQLQIDQIIYKIYELKEEDIKVIEEEFPNMPPKPNKNNNIKKVTLNYIRAIVKDILMSSTAKLYLDEEIATLIKQHIEKKFLNGYSIVEEIESILEKTIIEIIRGGAKISSSNITLSGKGSKDLDEPLLQQKVLAGTGINKRVVVWHLSHFLLEFEEEKKYVMQNEIRRLSNEVFRPQLKATKEKLQMELTSSERKQLEKQEKLLGDSVKTLEGWNVID
ncbi:Eco57I restriction-modification methylase domain-containing protein [Clostridium estertheticum]|uniref:Eco57I restriction-modification methylase domain-containing protein n=1 Tax=Clostridium estertheticum TaxID=238834 RepID=UPI001C6E6717|nr:DNA methyltransferase [Clostridium estertheticum]MBW9152349.1 N-6 DNA methylase [Clostridium estertheticum]WLC82796.1 Eco57I restriction-modification methylase domain-containing protein [Clostridium estertheticum]